MVSSVTFIFFNNQEVEMKEGGGGTTGLKREKR